MSKRYEAYIQHGSSTNVPLLTDRVECKEVYTWWQLKGLQFTATGYGAKIPTQYMVKYSGRWMRVYCRIYSNIGSLYIISKGLKLSVHLSEA